MGTLVTHSQADLIVCETPRTPSDATTEDLRLRVVQQEAAEIDRQIPLQTTQDHLENAGEVLPLPGGAGDLLQQTQSPQLSVQPRPRTVEFASAFD